MTPLLEVNRLKISYPPTNRVAVADVSFSIRQGEIVSLIGPSGCGKSSLLSAIAGFMTPASGQILLGGDVVRGPSAERNILQQGLALFPWMTCIQNIAYPLKIQGMTRRPRRKAALEMLGELGISECSNAYHWQLSGGQQQRVALARCFVALPRLVMMDEPFSHLDTFTKWPLYRLLTDIARTRNATVLLATHDIDEAILLSDRIILLTAGPAYTKKIINVDLKRPRDPTNPPGYSYMSLRAGLIEATST